MRGVRVVAWVLVQKPGFLPCSVLVWPDGTTDPPDFRILQDSTATVRMLVDEHVVRVVGDRFVVESAEQPYEAWT